MSDESLRARVLVVDRTRQLADRLRGAMSGVDRPEIVHLAKTTSAVQVAVDQGPWDVVVAGPSEETHAGLRRLAELRAAARDIGLVVAVNGKQPADLQLLVRAHPDQLVRLPAGPAVLRAALQEALRAVAQRRGVSADQAAASLSGRPDPATLARVYMVGGPTGGSGKTTIATSLAYLLARTTGKRVVLVDLDVQFGEVTAALQLKPAYTIYDILYDEHDRPHDETAIVEALSESLTPSVEGFAVLPAPRDPAQADAIGADEAAFALSVLRTQADYIVLDTPTGLRDVCLGAMDHTDHVVTVAQVDVPGIWNLKSYLQTLDRLGVERERHTIVLNKDMPDTGISAADAIHVLGPVAGTMPFSSGVTRALNAGRSLCAADPRDPAARALAEAVRHLLPAGADLGLGPAPRTRRRWMFWRKSR